MISLLSFIWSLINAARRRLFAVGLLRSVRLPVPVVSVGNLQAGGSGKTPIVVALAREALSMGRVPIVLMRGYRGEWSRTGGLIVPGVGDADPALCGDEAALIHDQVPGAWVGVGADRLASFERAMQTAIREGRPSPDWVVLDDGHQHLRIARDLEVVAVTDATRGEIPFRDWRGARSGPNIPCHEIRTKSAARDGALPRLQLRLVPPAVSEAEEKLWAVSGIGSPRDFESSLIDAGWRVVRRTDFPDHARYAPEWVAACLEEATRAGLRIALTGKDWVKWRALGVKPGAVRVFEPEPVFEPGDFARRILESSLNGAVHG